MLVKHSGPWNTLRVLFIYSVKAWPLSTFLCDKSFHYVASIKYKIPFADLQQKKKGNTSEREIVTFEDL